MHRLVDGFVNGKLYRVSKTNRMCKLQSVHRSDFTSTNCSRWCIMNIEHWACNEETARWLKYSTAQYTDFFIWFPWCERFKNFRMHSIGKRLDSIRMWKMVCISILLSRSPLNHSLFFLYFHLACVTKAKRMCVRLKRLKIAFFFGTSNKVRHNML